MRQIRDQRQAIRLRSDGWGMVELLFPFKLFPFLGCSNRFQRPFPFPLICNMPAPPLTQTGLKGQKTSCRLFSLFSSQQQLYLVPLGIGGLTSLWQAPRPCLHALGGSRVQHCPIAWEAWHPVRGDRSIFETRDPHPDKGPIQKSPKKPK